MLHTAYTSTNTPSVIEAARTRFGADCQLGSVPNADPLGPLATAPYSAQTHKVVGLAGLRSGPLFTVIARR